MAPLHVARSLCLVLLASLLLVACPRAQAPRPASRVEPPPAAVTLTYLGVAGWKLESRTGTLLVDPYVTRAATADDAVPLVPDAAAIAAYTPARADVVLVGHSHYDHALDVPAIARRTGAVVVGTESTANLASAGGVAPERIRVTRGGETLRFGPFTVHVVAGLHSLTGQENASIPRGVQLPMPARAYGEGGTLQYLVEVDGHTIFFVGSANFVEDAVRGLRPEVAVVAIGLREKVPDYTCRLLRALGGPALVLPNHFDAFREPLRPGSEELPSRTRAEVDSFAAEVRSCAPATRVHVPVPMRGLPLPREAPPPPKPALVSYRYHHLETTGLTDELILADGTRQPIRFARESSQAELAALSAVLTCGIHGTRPPAPAPRGDAFEQRLFLVGELRHEVLRTPAGPGRATPEDYREFVLSTWYLEAPFSVQGRGAARQDTSVMHACPTLASQGDLDRFVRVPMK